MKIIFLIFILLLIFERESGAQENDHAVIGSPTPEALLQDNSGTPIYLTPQPQTLAPSPTSGPKPTPMKVAGSGVEKL